MPELKLTRLEFAAALRRGHGRALQHVRQHGLSEVGDLVLESCLKNPAYDPQCEGSRAAWLFNMYRDSEDYGRFSAAILDALAGEADSYDLEHLCELSALMGKAGDEVAATALRSRVWEQSGKWPDSLYGCQPLVALDGIPAVVELARRFGQLLIDEPDERPPSVDYLTEGLGILDEAEKELRRLAAKDIDIRRYLDNEEAYASRERESQKGDPEQRRRERRERVRKELTLNLILNDAANGVGEYPGRYMSFGRNATSDELRVVLQRLVEEPQESVCRRLLWVFRRAPLPELHPKVWQLADAKDVALRDAALSALAQNQDPRVGELGRSRLRAGNFAASDSDVLDLFIRNYQPLDEQLISRALASVTPDDDEAHSLGYSVLDICEENPSCPRLEMLKWVYEATPCTTCREKAVEQMVDSGVIPPGIVAECLDDAEEDLRSLARELAPRYLGSSISQPES